MRHTLLSQSVALLALLALAGCATPAAPVAATAAPAAQAASSPLAQAMSQAGGSGYFKHAN